jgi:hypothetical protein
MDHCCGSGAGAGQHGRAAWADGFQGTAGGFGGIRSGFRDGEVVSGGRRGSARSRTGARFHVQPRSRRHANPSLRHSGQTADIPYRFAAGALATSPLRDRGDTHWQAVGRRVLPFHIRSAHTRISRLRLSPGDGLDIHHAPQGQPPCPTCGPLLDEVLRPETPISWSVP